MILLCAFVLTATPCRAQASSVRSVAASYQDSSIERFRRFFERLSSAETELQLDRGDAIHARDKSRAVSHLVNDMAAEQRLIEAFLESTTADPSGSSSPAQKLRASLAALGSDLDNLKTAAHPNSNEITKALSNKAWQAHGSAFRRVVLSAVKVPGFSLKDLEPPVQYNLTPVLFDRSEGIILADTTKPEKTIVARTFGGKTAAVQTGDEILAYRDSEEDGWVTVKNWADILHQPKDLDDEERTTRITVRLKRGSATREVNLSFIASSLYLE
jgi:hypothetical protein